MNNDKLKETRPFNIEHAKAGAPYACRNGTEATIVKFDGRSAYPLVGYFGCGDVPTAWSADGSYINNQEFSLVMTPLGHVDGKPVFVGDRVLDATGVERTVKNPGADFTRCRWPEPEKQYPVTGMTYEELCEAGDLSLLAPSGHVLRAIANAALRHAVDHGYLIVPTDKTLKNEQPKTCSTRNDDWRPDGPSSRKYSQR